jgi:phosphatidylglycerol---prolipoprotein diacylglyceryl transferase
MSAFGAILFVCFIAVTILGSRLVQRYGVIAPKRFQDMVIWLCLAVIVGARMIK